MSAEPAARLYTDQDMPLPVCLSIAGGEAVVFSARSPDRDGANQDGAALFQLEAATGVLAVADGLGGQPGGASAVRIALESLRGAIAAVNGDGTALRAGILNGIEAANRGVLDLGIGAGTTLAAVEIYRGILRPYHVGDSEIFVVGQRGLIKLQTVSHSPVGYALEAGVLDQDEALHHDERHLVSNLVGSAEMRIEVGSPLSLAPRDTLMLATDGLFDNLEVLEIVDLIRTKPLPRVAELLVKACAGRMSEAGPGKPSKPDDLTFILYRRGRNG
jgi:serine/threonine protein phosphatase PrpC